MRRPLAELVARRWPDRDAEALIRGGEILVDGAVVSNPRAQIATTAAVVHHPPADLNGRRKLAWALEHFRVDVAGNVALDVGASTGGFTTALLDAGARTVYAVDAGHGQLLGSLRNDSRVRNLERTNVGELTDALIPEEVDAVTVDVSYLSLTRALAEVGRVRLGPEARLLGLVKPMFELRLATIPSDEGLLLQARDRAVEGAAAAGWTVVGAEECPVRGGKGAVEFFVYARR